MKNLLFFSIVLLISFKLFSQQKVQRLVLLEEFTNASCGPCASQNPQLNNLLNANEDKVVAIKYQTNWPGTDPMNSQTQTWVGPRVSYYGVSGVPHGIVDGVSIANDCGSYEGSPYCLSQSDIDAAYAVPSSFIIDVNHHLSDDKDSIYIYILITAAEDYTGTNIKARVAMVEREIHFSTPPGSNGEKDFYDVLRAMYPNANGVSMPNSWTAGDTATLVFAKPIPSYVYNKAEIAIVAFLQDDGNKKVLQAGYSAPIPFEIDAEIVNIQNIPYISCQNDFTPSFSFKNSGQTEITSATFGYKIDNQTLANYNWNGNLLAGQSEVIFLPQQSTNEGAHTFSVEIIDINSQPDQNPYKNSQTANFHIIGSSVNFPLSETFSNSTFPPTNWIKHDIDKDNYGWVRKAGVGFNGAGSACMEFYYSVTGNTDDLYLPPLNLSSATQAYLTFNMAYARYNSTYFDRLQVQVSTDCGNTWNTLWDKSGTSLATAPDYSSGVFSPNSSQWRAESVNLNNYVGQSQVFIRFHAISGYGNNLYIDDVNVSSSPSEIEENSYNSNITIFPNPTNDYLNIVNNVENSLITITDLTGRIIYQQKCNSPNILISVHNFNAGMYILNIKNKSITINKVLVIEK